MEQGNHSLSGDILVIDDAPAYLKLLADILAGAGLAVRTATDGASGLESAKVHPPDLILLDVRMPGMDGFEVCRRLKAEPATTGIPVIFLTVMQDDESKIHGFRVGAVDFISKPCAPEEVMARVRTHLDLYKLQTSLTRQIELRTKELEQEIAKQKEAENALMESEEDLKKAQAIAHVGSWKWNVVNNDAVWSNETYRIFGASGSILNKHQESFIERIHPEDRARVGEALNDALNNRKEYDIQYRIILPDSSERVIHAVAEVIRNAQGEPLLMHGTVQDITEFKQSEEKLRLSEEQFRSVFEFSDVGMTLIDADYRFAKVNKSFCDMLGYSESELLTSTFREITHPDDLQSNIAFSDKLLSGEIGSFHMEKRYIHKNGSIVWGDLTVSAVRGSKGKFEHGIAIVQNITERKQTENALRLQSEITANAAEGIALIRADDGIIHYTNRKFEELFGYSPGELTGKLISAINAPGAKQPDETEREIKQAVMNRGVWSGEVLNLKKDGAKVWTFANVSKFQHPELGDLLITYQRDITDKKKSEETIWKQANFDMLTGLPNRQMFHDSMLQEIRKANRLCQKIALMFVDLDRFKEVNDTLGHDMGDTLLIEAAQRIRESIRATDMVARMGGDEFTITLSEFSDISFIERVAQTTLQQLAKPFKLGNDIVYVSGSIGITIFPDDASELDELLKNADQAMYEAKNLGRNRHSYFTHKMQESAQVRMSMINDLRGALSNGQLSICFQPIVEIATNNIYKAEALVRWNHPERGQVPPSSFIPLAEETGLIFEIGDWVFEESVSWAKRWRKIINPEFQVSINKSPVQFYSQSAEHSTWIEHLQNLGLPGNSITIEITEGLLMNNDSIIGDILFNFRDKGIQISVDDFGTGYSSLAYLNSFNVDYLKIDQSFTRNITPDSNDMALVEAIIVMAHKLGLKVIAEGVETGGQRDLLASVDCDYAQGYLYSRPIPPNEFEELLKNWKAPH